MSSDQEPCPKCGEPIGTHTVSDLRTHLSAMYDHDLPFEAMPQANQTIESVMAGSVAVKAGVHTSALGVHPVLVFDFSGPGGPLPPITLILDDTHMRSVRTLVGSAIDAAVKAARKAR